MRGPAIECLATSPLSHPPQRLQELEKIVREQRAQLHERRKRARDRRSDFILQVAAQAIGTTLGAGIVGLVAILLGILKDVPLVSILTILGAVVLVAGSLLLGFLPYRSLKPISAEHAEYMEQSRRARYRELGEKLARGEDPTKEDYEMLGILMMLEAEKPSKKPND